MSNEIKILRKPYSFICEPSVNDIINAGFMTTFEASHSFDPNDTGDGRWYCSLYWGDSNAPWKSDTISGVGYGETQQDAFKKAVSVLEITTGYIDRFGKTHDYQVSLYEGKAIGSTILTNKTLTADDHAVLKAVTDKYSRYRVKNSLIKDLMFYTFMVVCMFIYFYGLALLIKEAGSLV